MNITSIFADSAEFPTLLHFAACHGLEKLSNVLMDCLGFNDAIQMRNVSEMTPAELGIPIIVTKKKILDVKWFNCDSLNSVQALKIWVNQIP